MPVYEFGVELTVGDNTAFTVRGALRGLGYAELDRVERSELLRLRLPDGGLTIDDCGAALTHAEVVFNPNKHRLVRASAPDTDIYEAIVADVDDDSTALSELLRDRFGVNGLESVERATAWRLYERDGKPAGAERLEWACTSLLANKFSQTFSVRRSPTRIPIEPRP